MQEVSMWEIKKGKWSACKVCTAGLGNVAGKKLNWTKVEWVEIYAWSEKWKDFILLRIIKTFSNIFFFIRSCRCQRLSFPHKSTRKPLSYTWASCPAWSSWKQIHCYVSKRLDFVVFMCLKKYIFNIHETCSCIIILVWSRVSISKPSNILSVNVIHHHSPRGVQQTGMSIKVNWLCEILASKCNTSLERILAQSCFIGSSSGVWNW